MVAAAASGACAHGCAWPIKDRSGDYRFHASTGSMCLGIHHPYVPTMTPMYVLVMLLGVCIGHVAQTMTAVYGGQRGRPGAARSQRRRSCWSSAVCARCAQSTSCCRMRTAPLCSQARLALVTLRTWCLLGRPPGLQARAHPSCQATCAWHVRPAVVWRTCTPSQTGRLRELAEAADLDISEI